MPATREGIPHSPWNKAILTGIAETFKDAVLQFCGHHTLQFQWMRYLPDSNISGEFWAPLLAEIIRLLKDTPILRPRSGRALKKPHQLRWQANTTVDCNGNPLFDDILQKELYLSPQYLGENTRSFGLLGVQVITVNETLERVHADLSNPFSRMKSIVTSEDWHTRSARLLMEYLDQYGLETSQQVRNLNLIPLQDSTWVSGASGVIYNPCSDGVPIPTDLGLRVIQAEPLKNRERKALFSKLGVADGPPSYVISRIFNRYNLGAPINLESAVMHLRYLYWELPVHQEELPHQVHLVDQNGIAVFRKFITDGKSRIVDDLYFESDDEYSFPKLLEGGRSRDTTTVPGFHIRYINRVYMDTKPLLMRKDHISWQDWLEAMGRVRRIPRLTDPSDRQLSDVFSYIIKHRSDKLVGTLKAHWDTYKSMRPEIKTILSQAKVPCENMLSVPLGSTYMPFVNLKKICIELGVEGKLPFLRAPGQVDDNGEDDWKYLREFGVRQRAGLEFYLDILRQVVGLNRNVCTDLSAMTKTRLFLVYNEILRCSKGKRNREQLQYVLNYLASYVTHWLQKSIHRGECCIRKQVHWCSLG